MTDIHNDIIVEIDEKIKNQEKQDLIETWRPLRDGNLFKGYLKSKDEISEKDKAEVIFKDVLNLADPKTNLFWISLNFRLSKCVGIV